MSPPASGGRWLKRAGWSLADQLAAPALQLALTPLLLGRLGDSEFGLWVLLATFLIASQLVSAGSTVGLLSELARLDSGGRNRDAASLVRTALGFTVIGGGLSMACGLILVFLAPESWHRTTAFSFATYVALAILLVVAQEIDNLFGNALKALGRFDVAARIELTGRVAWALGLLAVTLLSPTAVACMAVTLGASCAKTAFKVLAVHGQLGRSAPIWRPCWSRAQDRRILLSFGGWQLIQSFSALLFLSVDRWIVGWQLGTAHLAAYSICLQLAQLPHTLLSAALQVLVPMASSMSRGVTGLATSRKQFKPLVALAIAGMLLPAALWLAAGPLLSGWISAPFADQHTALARQLIVAFALLSFNVVPHYCLLGLGKVRTTAVVNLMAGAVGTTSMLIALPWLETLHDFAALRAIYGVVLLSLWFSFWRSLPTQATTTGH